MSKKRNSVLYRQFLQKILPLLRRLPPLWQALLAGLFLVTLALWFWWDSVLPPHQAPAPPTIDLGALPNTTKSFSTAKSWLYGQVYFDHRESFYCGCRYNRDLSVDWESCGYIPRQNANRASRIEAEHVTPAAWLGQNRPCWQKDACQDPNGQSYGGRRCCLESDPVFLIAHNDLHNLVPAVGEINGDRRHYPFGEIPGEARAYGACDFEVAEGLSEPSVHKRGDIARTLLYMEKTYALSLPSKQRNLLEQWHQEDPADDWERIRNARIKRLQGNANPFISN